MFGDLILKCHGRLSIAVRVAISSKALEQLIKYSISFSSISPDGNRSIHTFNNCIQALMSRI